IIKGTETSDSSGSAETCQSTTCLNEGDDNVKIRVFFENDCGMENIRAFMLLNQIHPCCEELSSIPSNPENDSSLSEEIIKNGFLIIFKPSESVHDVVKIIESSLNVKS